MHAKDFEIWKNILWKWWVDCFKPQSINGMMWYFRVFIVKIFSLLWSIFFSRKLCFLWPSCLLLIAESISLDTSGKPTVGLFSKVISPSWIILSISLDELNWIDCWRVVDHFSWNNFYFIVIKELTKIWKEWQKNIRGFLKNLLEYYFLNIIVGTSLKYCYK